MFKMFCVSAHYIVPIAFKAKEKIVSCFKIRPYMNIIVFFWLKKKGLEKTKQKNPFLNFFLFFPTFTHYSVCPLLPRYCVCVGGGGSSEWFIIPGKNKKCPFFETDSLVDTFFTILFRKKIFPKIQLCFLFFFGRSWKKEKKFQSEKKSGQLKFW